MITIHIRKCYKTLIDSGAAISLIRYSTYQLIDDSFKTPIQLTTSKLNTADGSPMMALGMTAFYFRIADFKFTHNFIKCDRLPETEIRFGIDIQKKFSLSYAWDKEKNCYIQNDGRFLTYARNCDQIATIKLLNKLSRYLLAIMESYPSRSKVTQSQDIWHTSRYYKKDPNINIVNGIHNIKGKTSVNILVSNYTNKHIMFNKGEYVVHLEPSIEDIEEEKNLHF